MTEHGKWIDNFEGKYRITRDGRVFSYVGSKVRELKTQYYPNGYKFVQLGTFGGSHLVHRLVAKAYIDTDDDSLQVNHKNGIRDDNRVENLDWLSCSDNHKHSYRELNRKKHSLTRAIILVKRGVEIEMPSILAVSKFLSRNLKSVWIAAKGGTKCAGYEVHYVF